MLDLALKIKQWGQELGFQQVGITDTNLSAAEVHLQDWLANNYHGEMDYMQRHGLKRSRPALLHDCQGNLCPHGLPDGVVSYDESGIGQSYFGVYITLCFGA